MKSAPHLDLFRAIVQVARARNYHLINYRPGGPFLSRQNSTQASWKETEAAPQVSDTVRIGSNSTSYKHSTDRRGRKEATSSNPLVKCVQGASWQPIEALALLESQVEQKVTPHAPPIPNTPSPLNRPVLSPRRRSQFLSQLRHSDPQTSYSAYASLFLETSTSATFTPSELYHVARHSRTSVGLSMVNQRRRLQGVLDELDYTIDGESELGGVKVTKVVAAGRHARKVSVQDLLEAERVFSKVWPVTDGNASDNRRPAFTASGNHLLYLAAMIPSQRDFARVQKDLESRGFKPDSYTDLAQITLLRRQRRPDAIPAIIAKVMTAEAVPGSPPRPQDRIVLLNAALWTFAKLGRWDVVGPAYNKLHSKVAPNSEPLFTTETGLDFFSTSPHHTLVVPDDLQPSDITYRLMIHALAYHGNFVPSLTVFQHMLARGEESAPAIGDYMSLFHGFARYGVVAAPADEGVARMASWIHPAPIALTSSHPHKPGSRLKSRGARLAALWERGTGFVESDNAEVHVDNDWTFDALGSLFTAFLAVPPPKTGHAIAPTPRAVYYLLLAFARTSGTDLDVLKEVWRELQVKFGEGNSEGWARWTVNRRLERLVQSWDAVSESGTAEN